MKVHREIMIRNDCQSHSSAQDVKNSSYSTTINNGLVHLVNSKSPTERERLVHHELRRFVVSGDHPCAGARSAFNKATYRFATYAELGSAEGTSALALDLCTFVRELPDLSSGYGSFIAVFGDLKKSSEAVFETKLWKQLNLLHELDCALYDPVASSAGEDINFSFSFAGTALFVVGMHPGSSRLARRFAFHALVFNPHSQFDVLRTKGQYDRFASVIRKRE
jgi:FPC/CPF motif-containing protein YcgG